MTAIGQESSESHLVSIEDSGRLKTTTDVVVAPVILAELHLHPERIHMVWADGANLAPHHVQFTVPVRRTRLPTTAHW